MELIILIADVASLTPQLQNTLLSSPNLDLLVARAQVLAGFLLGHRSPVPAPAAVPPAGTVPARQVCVAEAQRLLLAQPRAGPLCVLPPRKQLVALVKYK